MTVLMVSLVGILVASGAAAGAVTSGVGRNVSVYFDDLGGVAQPVSSGAVVASVPLPTKYNSRRNFLIIKTTVSETCPAASIASTVTVGGFSTTNGMTLTDCEASNGGLVVFTRTWQLLPESAGGPRIPPGSVVELRLFSGGNPANAKRGFVNVQVEYTR